MDNEQPLFNWHEAAAVVSGLIAADAVFKSRPGSTLRWGPCRDCGQTFGVLPCDVVKAFEGEVVCNECEPRPQVDKSVVLTDRQRHACKTTRT